MGNAADSPSLPTQLLDRLLDGVSTGILAVDPDRRVVVFNTEAELLVGASRAGVLGRPLHTLAGSSDSPVLAALAAALDEVIEQGRDLRRQSFSVEVVEEFRTFGYTATPLIEGADALGGGIILFADLTAVRREERARSEMECIGRLSKALSWMAHQVKNPLATIQMYAGLCARHGTPEVQDSIQIIRDQVALAQTRISDSLRAFSPQPEAPTPQATDLARLLREYAQREGHALPHVALRIDVGAPAYVPLSEEDCLLVVSHLVANGVEAIVGQGAIRIRVMPGDEEVLLVVEDTGRGFPAGDPQRLLQPFFSSKARSTGMGLWMVDRLVRAVRGNVRLESGAEAGARVIVSLPALHPSRLRGRRVLVVEDEEMLRRLIARELERHGAVVQEAGSGDEALSLMASTAPDLVVTDLSLPGIDGSELVRRLDPDLPVVLISGWQPIEAGGNELRRTAFAYLAKPFDLEELTLAACYLLWEVAA